MAIQKIFRSATPSFRFFFRNGVPAVFMNGKYTTDNKELEHELMAEVGEIGRTKSRNPYIYVDENEPTLDTEALSSLEIIKLQAKEEARQELLAEMAAQQARAMDASANVSSTSANFATSINTTAKIEAAANGEEVKTPEGEQANQEQAKATVTITGGLAARLANLGK